MIPFRIRALDHVVLRVRDMDRMIRFYVDVLGCSEERRVASIGLVQLRAGSALIDLVPGRGPAEGRNVDHFALTVEPYDEPVLRAHLAAAGASTGESGSRYGAEGEGPSLYLDDPEGNTVELKGPPHPR
ncbi:MAG: VOC family protein [Alphaproteobacteria bacterium]